MRKAAALFLCVSLLLAGLCLPARAETEGDFAFTVLEDGTAEIKKYTGNATDLTIPAVLGGRSVSGIGNSAFFNCTSLTRVTVPDGVTRIGDKAFYNCTGLTRVTLPDGVTSIGNDAFFWCRRLSRVNIPDSVVSIGDNAFRNCTSLTGLTLPDSVTSIGELVFYNCSSLGRVTVGQNSYAMRYCISRGIPCTLEDAPAATAGDFEFTVLEDGTAEIAKYTGSAAELTIPSVLGGRSVTGIGDEAFAGCGSLTGVTIPDGVVRIGAWAFYDCGSLKAVTLPDSVTSLGLGIFVGCESLTGMAIPDSVTDIGDWAFDGCDSLGEIAVGQNSYARQYCVENGLPCK